MVKIKIKANDKMIDIKIVLAAMICITILEIIALLKGINGILLTSVIAVIAGLAGLFMKTPKIIRR